MATRGSSGKKKSDTSLRIKISTKKADKRAEKDDEDESPEEEEEEPEIIDSGNSEEDEDNESEEEVMPKSRSRNVSFNKSAFSMPDDISKLMNRVLCTSCGKQVNPMNPGAVRRHPWLKVVTCKKCYKFLKSGAFTRDGDGVDEQCRWCGDGGRLYGCDYCHNCFCRSCIKRNLGRTEAGAMESEDNSKWKCYLCKPKKVKHLADDCTKILDYIDKEEKKEQAREERAKLREKEKAEKHKAEREQKHKDREQKAEERKEKHKGEESKEKHKGEESKEKHKGEDKKEKESTPQRSTRSSFPAPKSQDVVVKKEKESTPQRGVKNTIDNPVVIDDSPAKPVVIRPALGLLRPGTYTNPTPDQGVKGVKKMDNGVFAVTVGPRPAQTVVTYASNTVGNAPKAAVSILPNNLKIQPNQNTFTSALSQALTSSQARVPTINYNNSTKRLVKTLAPMNDLKALKEVVHPYSIDSTVEKLTTVAQSLNLLLNSVKTDIAIAKLSQANMFQARNTAGNSVKNGLEVFFNSIREVFNVQFIAAHPRLNTSDVKETTSTPIADKVGIKTAKLDVSTIPICLDDSEVKDSASEDSKSEGKKEEDDCMILSDNEESKSNVVMEVDDGDGGKIQVEKNDPEEDDEEDDDDEDDNDEDDDVVEEVEEEDEGSVKEESKMKEKKGGKAKGVSESGVRTDEIKDKKKVKDEDKVEDKKELGKVEDKKEVKDEDKVEDKKEVKDNDKDKKKSDRKVTEEKDIKKSEGEDSPVDKTGDSENTAAELELLKEMADELNDLNENDTGASGKKPVKSDKGKKPENDAEEPKKERETRSKKKLDMADSVTDKQSSDDENVAMEVDQEDHGSDVEDEDANKSRSRRRRKAKSKDSDSEITDKQSKTTKDDSKIKGKTDENASSKSSTKHSRSKSTSDKSSESPSKKDRKKGSKDSKHESKDENSLDIENLETESQGDDNDSSKSSAKHTRSKSSSDNSSESKKDRKKGSKDSKHESKDQNSSDIENIEDESASSKSSARHARNKSSSDKSAESSSKKEDKKKSSKVSKQESKDENDSDTENLEAERQLLELAEKEVSAEESDDTDSDDSDLDEPKKRRKKRNASKAASSKTNTPKTSSDDRKQSKSSKRSSKKSNKDDSDADQDVEKLIKSASKETKLKSSKSDGKKSSKSTKKTEEEDPGSDSSNYDADLEKEIKALEKDTKLRPRRSCSTAQETEEKGKKDSKESGKKGAKGKKADVESDEEEVEDDVDESEEESEPEVMPKGRSSRSRRADGVTKKSEEKSEGKKKGKDAGKKSSAKDKKKSMIEDLSSDEDEAMDEPEDEEEEEEDDDTDDVTPSQLKKLKANQKASQEDSEADSEEFLDEEGSNDSSDPEVSFPKMKSPVKGKKGKEEEKGKRGRGKKSKAEEETLQSDEDSDDFISPKKKKKKIKDELLDIKVSDSDDSDVGGKKKKGKKGGKRKRKDESEEQASEDSDGDKKKKGKGKKRRRIKKVLSSDSEKEPGAEDDIGGVDDGDEEEEFEEDGKGGFLKRRKIRKVQTNKKLGDETKAARKAEEDRRKRIEERQKEYNNFVEVEGVESEEELPEGTERVMEDDPKADAIAKILGSPKKIPVTVKCVLEIDKDKKPLIEVDRTLVRKLKPHQVEAVRFMYNCCVESLERLKKGEESGCILAHCMGLGKTLSVISFVHTMLRSVKLTKMTKCLVVCPLNTVLNWVNEFEMWLGDVDFEIEVFEMSKVKVNFERAQMLKDWHEGGAGVMILGYDMYRNLVQGSHCKNKKQKKIFYETLADPGPDIVVCDEGHILKNDATSLSKSMNKIKTRKRIVLTGTPLQNNLGEYHCMVNFVKPNLLGNRKEFANRFVNPITNGQCKDSTSFDVKLMKRRAHILHEHLAGCVQRKDYSALTKFLPPKLEYVVSVRLAKVQMDLYDKYLEMSGMGANDITGKGARLFKDYQALMRIWTHPWVLKLDEIRQENKRMYDDSEDSFIDDSSDGEDSFIDDSTTSPSDNESDIGEKKKKKKKKKKGGGSDSGSSDDDSSKKNGENNDVEVINKWTSRRRGNEEGAGSSWMEDWGYAQDGPKEVTSEWWSEFVKEEDEGKLDLSGKMMLLFQILKMCEDIGDKVLVFSQSLLSLDIIEDFLRRVDEANNPVEDEEKKEGEEKKEDGDNKDGKKKAEGKKEEEKNGEKKAEVNGEVNGSGDKAEEKKEDPLAQYGKSWTKGADYFRMDGSTSSHHRKYAQDSFNDPENYRARLFLISTKAGSLGINLVAANRVIIFDASWNPSHDIQSIFRVYRFGQVKPVYVYRFLAQGTMEEKIYERQVTKQSLSQRVVDEHQIERHFTASDLQELYKFTPDRLDDPNRGERPLPMLPKDHMLAELMSSHKEWIVTFHEHDSLLENKIEQELTEEEKKAAWEDYEEEKKGRPPAAAMMMYQNPGVYNQQGLQSLMMHGQQNLGQQAVLQIVQDLKSRFPNLPPEIFQQRVQAVLRQVLTQQIMQQNDMRGRQIDQQKLNELNRLNQLKQQIQQQQQMVSSQQQVLGISGFNNMGATSAGAYNLGGATGGFQPPTSITGYAAQAAAMNQTLRTLQNRLQTPATATATSTATSLLKPKENNKS